jgi:hypothetical protein
MIFAMFATAFAMFGELEKYAVKQLIIRYHVIKKSISL